MERVETHAAAKKPLCALLTRLASFPYRIINSGVISTALGQPFEETHHDCEEPTSIQSPCLPFDHRKRQGNGLFSKEMYDLCSG